MNVRAIEPVKSKLASSAESKLVEEAARRGEELRGDLESKTVAYGRWLLDAVFDGNTTAALDDKKDNQVWREILALAGGPRLRLSSRLVYVALRIAAHDKRIQDGAWQGLDVGRKELLLPLQAQPLMIEAARHVTTFKLSQAKTWAYVSELLAKEGNVRRVRASAVQIRKRLRTCRESVATPAVLKHLRSLQRTMQPEERELLLGEIDELRVALEHVTKVLQQGG